MEFFTFQIFGAMSSWGAPTVGEHRHSEARPSKSALLGLLAGALGYLREEDEKHVALQQDYGLSTLTYQTGNLHIEYQTSQTALKPAYWHRTAKDALSGDTKTSLSERHFLLEHYSIVALWQRDTCGGTQLQDLKCALDTPLFTPYLGRKSCTPSLPFAGQITQISTIKEALDAYPVFDARQCGSLRTYAWEEGADPGMQAELSVERFDHIGSRARWQHQPRVEYVCYEQKESQHVY